jgi:hypothetical protein
VDAITIGLAFTVAQSAVSHIKQAVALGKDINSLYGQFSKFFESSDAIHRERTKIKAKAQRLGKTDAELGHEALQIAMASKALRDTEKQLKDMLYWSGNAQVWDDMMKERVRMMKERAAAESALEKAKIQKREDLSNIILNVIIGITSTGILSAFGTVAIRQLLFK